MQADLTTAGALAAGQGPVAYLYVLGSSSDPDRVECGVPWAVDRRTIFFGPCKKALRQHFKQHILGDADDVVPPRDIYVIGFNKLPSPKGPRKIVWAGRVSRVMTFVRAYDFMSGPQYMTMLASRHSPMNVEPIPGQTGGLLGYRRRPTGLHRKSWPRDLATTLRHVERRGDELLVKGGATAARAFRRDACFTAESIFFARGTGLEIDDALVRILRDVQPTASGVDAVAVFGRIGGAAEGLRGRYLEVLGSGAERIVEWLREHTGHEDPARSASLAPRDSKACR